MPSHLTLPLTLERKPHHVVAVALGALVFLAAAPIAAAVGLVVARTSDLIDVASDHPLATFQLIIGLLVWSALFVLPLAFMLHKRGSTCIVETTSHHVTVTTTTVFGVSRSVLPLRAFDSIVHVVRTSLSGVRHELLLVDLTSKRRVVFHVADRIDRDTIDGASRLLGLPERHANEVLAFNPARRGAASEQALPAMAA